MRRNLGIQPARTGPPADRPPRPEDAAPTDPLAADCARCFGLCCVALPFTRSTDFAIDKAGGEPCVNLGRDFGCLVHGRLRDVGFAGCTVFDCFGAGQQVAQSTFAGRSWRDDPESAGSMFETFAVMRQLHELLWYLRDASTRASAAGVRSDIEAARISTEELTGGSAAALAVLDVDDHRRAVDRVLQRVGALVRAEAGPPVAGRRRDFRRADLVGRSLRGADLRGADLRVALLIGSDLRGADLRFADLIGADLRGAALHGADLSSSVFLTQFQVNAAGGDRSTLLPPALGRPPYWS